MLVPCPTLSRDEEYTGLHREDAIEKYKEQFDEEFISSTRNNVLDRLAAVSSLKDLKRHIVDEVIDTPGTYADQYNLGAGTPFALSHGFSQLSVTRPGPLSTGMPNVCYCGASSRPGNGVPLVLTGAKLTAEKVIAMLERIHSEHI